MVFYNSKDPDQVDGVHYDRLIPVLVNEVQSLKTIIEELKEEINILKKK